MDVNLTAYIIIQSYPSIVEPYSNPKPHFTGFSTYRSDVSGDVIHVLINSLTKL
jgi:hypothetical protein